MTILVKLVMANRSPGRNVRAVNRSKICIERLYVCPPPGDGVDVIACSPGLTCENAGRAKAINPIKKKHLLMIVMKGVCLDLAISLHHLFQFRHERGIIYVT